MGGRGRGESALLLRGCGRPLHPARAGRAARDARPGRAPGRGLLGDRRSLEHVSGRAGRGRDRASPVRDPERAGARRRRRSSRRGARLGRAGRDDPGRRQAARCRGARRRGRRAASEPRAGRGRHGHAVGARCARGPSSCSSSRGRPPSPASWSGSRASPWPACPWPRRGTSATTGVETPWWGAGGRPTTAFRWRPRTRTAPSGWSPSGPEPRSTSSPAYRTRRARRERRGAFRPGPWDLARLGAGAGRHALGGARVHRRSRRGDMLDRARVKRTEADR